MFKVFSRKAKGSAGLDATVRQGRGGIRVLLLQGPVGPFFSQLQAVLRRLQWDALRVNFNAGDLLYSGQDSCVNYTGHPDDWPDWLESFLLHYKPDAILMFGDQRPIHLSARSVAGRLGIKVVCFEEGYKRPEYITMELGCNNAGSALCRWERDVEDVAFVPQPEQMPSNGFRNMASFAARYYAALYLDFFRFPYYRHHRERGLLRECVMWGRNAIRKWLWRNSNLSKIQNIVESLDGSYFVVALQVHDDLQLRAHGCGWSVERLVETCISSFARFAHDGHHLVIKAHPLDRGHSSYREIVCQLVALNKLGGRVHFIDDGALGLLSRHSRGMVTINSTSAVTSLGHNKPVLALGNSFYVAMTANGSDFSEDALNRFWRLTPLVDSARWTAFNAQMISSSQVNGSFYIPEKLEYTCEHVAWRLHDMVLGMPAQEPPVSNRVPQGIGSAGRSARSAV